MGMALVKAYPRARLRRVGNMYRVTWAEVDNSVWYREFVSWARAMYFATTGKEPYGI